MMHSDLHIKITPQIHSSSLVLNRSGFSHLQKRNYTIREIKFFCRKETIRRKGSVPVSEFAQGLLLQFPSPDPGCILKKKEKKRKR